MGDAAVQIGECGFTRRGSGGRLLIALATDRLGGNLLFLLTVLIEHLQELDLEVSRIGHPVKIAEGTLGRAERTDELLHLGVIGGVLQLGVEGRDLVIESLMRGSRLNQQSLKR